MRVFNKDKTKELNAYDLEAGYLLEDKLPIAHHEAEEATEGVWHYETVAQYANGGKEVKRVWDTEPTEAKEAYDEYEDILVYIEYTEAELADIKRGKREPLLEAFDKWEKAVLRGRETDDVAIMDWYRSLLELEASAFENVPQRIGYYLR